MLSPMSKASGQDVQSFPKDVSNSSHIIVLEHKEMITVLSLGSLICASCAGQLCGYRFCAVRC